MDFQGFLYRRIRTLLGKNMKEISLCNLKSPSPAHSSLRSTNKDTFCHLSEIRVSSLLGSTKGILPVTDLTSRDTPMAWGGLLSPRVIWAWGVPESKDTAHLVLLGSLHCQLPHPEGTFWILTEARRCACCFTWQYLRAAQSLWRRN